MKNTYNGTIVQVNNNAKHSGAYCWIESNGRRYRTAVSEASKNDIFHVGNVVTFMLKGNTYNDKLLAYDLALVSGHNAPCDDLHQGKVIRSFKEGKYGPFATIRDSQTGITYNVTEHVFDKIPLENRHLLSEEGTRVNFLLTKNCFNDHLTAYCITPERNQS